MSKCRECGAEVSDQAKVCPKCGVAKPVRKTSILTWVAAAVIVPAVSLAVFAGRGNDSGPRPAAAPRPPTEREVRASNAYDTLRQIKRRLRNPDSVRWEAVLSSADASTMCVQYRAQNGFGGMTRERIVVAGNQAAQSEKLWAAKCKGLPYDLADEASSWTSM